jgi:hypothetical protein
MSSSGGLGEPSYRVLGAKPYSRWRATNPPDEVLLEVDWWIDGLYDRPWQSPSVTLVDAALGLGPPDDVREVVIRVGDAPRVKITYSVWESLRTVVLLFFTPHQGE